ncbi:MAG: acetylornithine deacetylase [Sphingobacteriales bacterium SCN 48-20]|jgi:acetylornithine deacetylase|uniref:M20 family metallo-hydrolase n=1 Tax=Terrimonas ferruginea TaxID=249 RepID=UPI00086B4693|nr:M20 family metallo-hydrolase [Terrimonas ferruginea]MBN8781444.1 M20 family metallo-hydrolase [Terrimonas ferruginea]ODT92429.1 MAG: acetylornithine deacetylase [Sphingobacteriales bacterium SCN 48-20]OJW44609.1 MAG: acetylornithine deacetylase [Sphingobacteriales bacterium 48-107]
MNDQLTILQTAAVALLKQLIATPSFSKEEDKTALLLETFFTGRQIPVQRIGNNVIVRNKHYDPGKPTLLLNSHHDTVKPNPQYTKDPFSPDVEDGKLFGLGSNDAGGCLVSLAATFLYFYEHKGPYNVIFAATAEEEISGTGGIELIINDLPPIAAAIVGEPTQMQMAVAERGLMVIDCVSHGKAGHAARNEGENALYKALKDIEWFRSYQFDRVSDLLGPSRMNVTVIETENKAHNVVPAVCRFVVDTRINECYTFEEVLEIIRTHVDSEVLPRSTRLRSTSIALDHPLVKAGIKLGRTYYGSPTTSDKALMPFPSLKMGPGDSARSHTADEYIYVKEIEDGIALYIQLINEVQNG